MEKLKEFLNPTVIKDHDVNMIFEMFPGFADEDNTDHLKAVEYITEIYKKHFEFIDWVNEEKQIQTIISNTIKHI
jgi:hypothetical protein